MDIELDATRKEVLSRLRTIRGHVSGIERMVQEKKPCTDILLQIAAVRSALDKTGEHVIRNYFETCWEEFGEDPETKAKDVVAEVLRVTLEFLR